MSKSIDLVFQNCRGKYSHDFSAFSDVAKTSHSSVLDLSTTTPSAIDLAVATNLNV